MECTAPPLRPEVAGHCEGANVLTLCQHFPCLQLTFSEVEQSRTLCRCACKVASVQISSVAQSCPTLCDPMNRSTPGLPVHHQLPEFTQTQSIESVMPSSHLILCRPLFLLPPIPPSIRVFSNESTSSHAVAKVLEFQL